MAMGIGGVSRIKRAGTSGILPFIASNIESEAKSTVATAPVWVQPLV